MDQQVTRLEQSQEASPAARRSRLPPARLERPLQDTVAPPAVPPAKRRGRGLIAPLASIAILIIIGLIAWRLLGTNTAHTPKTPPQTVALAIAKTGDMPETSEALGTVTPLVSVTVRTQIAGQLVRLGFTEGQEVKKGDFLAQVDDRPYQALIEQYQGTLAHDQGLLAQAKTDYQRYSTLNRQDSIARQQVDDQFYLIKQYEGSVAADQAQIDAQRLNITYCHIVAPVDGRVGLRQVDAGNYVQTSDTNGIVVITLLRPISVLFTLPEDSIPVVTQRLKQGATLPVAAWDRANTTKIADGHLETLDNQVDTTTGTIKLRAIFDNDDEALFPNQFVNAALLVDTLHGTILVPTAAIQHGAPGAFVYVVGADNKVAVRDVTIGPTDGQSTAVTKGIAAGEHVVVDGADRLRDGAQVAIADPAANSGDGRRHKPGAEQGQGQGSGSGTRADQGQAGQAPDSQPSGRRAPADQGATLPSGDATQHHHHHHDATEKTPATGDAGQTQ